MLLDRRPCFYSASTHMRHVFSINLINLIHPDSDLLGSIYVHESTTFNITSSADLDLIGVRYTWKSFISLSILSNQLNSYALLSTLKIIVHSKDDNTLDINWYTWYNWKIWQNYPMYINGYQSNYNRASNFWEHI